MYSVHPYSFFNTGRYLKYLFCSSYVFLLLLKRSSSSQFYFLMCISVTGTPPCLTLLALSSRVNVALHYLPHLLAALPRSGSLVVSPVQPSHVRPQVRLAFHAAPAIRASRRRPARDSRETDRLTWLTCLRSGSSWLGITVNVSVCVPSFSLGFSLSLLSVCLSALDNISFLHFILYSFIILQV